MSIRNEAPIGTPCWVDIATSDVNKTRNFYCEILKWTAGEQNSEFEGYFQFFKGDTPVAGAMLNTSDGRIPDSWTTYIATNDLTTLLMRAEVSYGKVVIPAMPIADLGSMAIILDSEGVRIGIWEPNTFFGFGVYNEPGAPRWFELQSKQYDVAIKFYRDVFQCQTQSVSDTPEFRYTTVVNKGENHAGIMDASDLSSSNIPSNWSVYFGVADADETLATAQKLGGATISASIDTPFGRVATIADPTGATFKIMAT